MLTFSQHNVRLRMGCVAVSLWITVLTGAGVVVLGGAVSPGLDTDVAGTEGYGDEDRYQLPLPDDNLSETSKTHLCYAQCMAKCYDEGKMYDVEEGSTEWQDSEWDWKIDNENGIPTGSSATQDSMDQGVYEDCPAKCEMFMNNDWLQDCGFYNERCIESCLYLHNTTNPDSPSLPIVPSLNLHQVSPYLVNLSWDSTSYTARELNILYVVEAFYWKNGTSKPEVRDADEWVFIEKTEDTSLRIELGECQSVEFRVASVSQFGTLGFDEVMNYNRDELPRPGQVQQLDIIGDIYYQKDTEKPDLGDNKNGNFVIDYSWKTPPGWRSEDMVFEVEFDDKHCNHFNLIPPRPVPSYRQVPGTDRWECTVVVHNTALGCIYSGVVVAKSKQCLQVGETRDIILDVSDCSKIRNWKCAAQEKEAPGGVKDVRVAAVNGNNKVEVRWQPPDNLGWRGWVDYYALQWGVVYAGNIQFKLLESIEGKIEVPGNKTETVIKLNRTGVEYGIVVVAQAYDEDGLPMKSDDYINAMAAHVCIELDPMAGQWELSTSPDFGESKTSSGENALGENNLAAKHIAGEEDNEDDIILLGVLLGVAAMIVVVIVTITIVRRQKMATKNKPWTVEGATENQYSGLSVSKQAQGCLVENPFYEFRAGNDLSQIFPMDRWEIPASSLTLGEILGHGAFGQVVKGTLHTTPQHLPSETVSLSGGGSFKEKTTQTTVAVKLLLDYADDMHRQDFLQEIELMKSIGVHPHIVSIVGCCTLTEPLCLIVEHMPSGDLLHHLRRHRQHRRPQAAGDAPVEKLTLLDLLSFARQISVGMEFLSQKGFVHRDLATRNVLVGDANSVKIGDFGLTRYIYDDKVYVTKKGGKLPLKWMAIEAIFDLMFTSASDVWSFGVVLFELVTLGGVPYPTIANRDLLKELQAGFRMERPDNCPHNLYAMMQECWQERPEERPSFTDLRGQLEALMEEHTSSPYLTIQVDSDNYYSGSLGTESTTTGSTKVGSTSGHTVTTESGNETEMEICPAPMRTLSSSSSQSSSSTWSYDTGGGSRNRHIKHSSPIRILRPTRRTDLLRVSTCSHDELLPSHASSSATSSDGGGIALQLSSLESIGETKL